MLGVGPQLGRCKCHGRRACVNGVLAARTVTVVTRRARQTRGFFQGKQFQVPWASSLLRVRLMHSKWSVARVATHAPSLAGASWRALGGELQSASVGSTLAGARHFRRPRVLHAPQREVRAPRALRAPSQSALCSTRRRGTAVVAAGPPHGEHPFTTSRKRRRPERLASCVVAGVVADKNGHKMAQWPVVAESCGA